MRPISARFQNQGFLIQVVGGNNQTARTGQAFAAPLSVTVQSLANDPVAGGVVTFTAPQSGPSAVLSAGTASIGQIGQASVTATANNIAGSYVVATSTAGAAGSAGANFILNNQSVSTLKSAPGGSSPRISLTPGVYVAGSTLCVVGGSASNSVTIEPVGAHDGFDRAGRQRDPVGGCDHADAGPGTKVNRDSGRQQR